MSGRRGHRDRDCPKAEATFEQLLCVEFDVLFEVDAQIEDGSITVEAIDIDNDGDFDNFR
jgi:hypothetical protein